MLTIPENGTAVLVLRGRIIAPVTVALAHQEVGVLFARGLRLVIGGGRGVGRRVDAIVGDVGIHGVPSLISFITINIIPHFEIKVNIK